MRLVNSLQTGNALTANGMTTNSSSLSKCLDLFYQIGSSRHRNDKELQIMFSEAFGEDSLKAMKILFNARDIRGGKGERKVFLNLIKYLASAHPSVLKKNVHLIPEFGRWKDVLELFDTHLEDTAIDVIVEGLKNEKTRGLCAKWVPRQGKRAVKIRKALGIQTPKEFRRMIVSLSSQAGVVEQKMCARQWTNIEYSKLPSIAAKNYRKAFERQDTDRYLAYLESLEKGETKVNAGALYPHDITYEFMGWQAPTDKLLEAQWQALPNFLEGSKERILPVIDTSSSMNTIPGKNNPLYVAVSLGLYIAERNEGIFKDSFISFNSVPKLHVIKGKSLYDRVQYVKNADWGGSTNIQGTFKLILDAAKKHSLPEEEMPTMILILSDMEFNQSDRNGETAIQMMENEYQAAGYKIPKIVFWNLWNNGNNFPALKEQPGVAMISGFHPSVIKPLVAGDQLPVITPEIIMLETINDPRYDVITI